MVSEKINASFENIFALKDSSPGELAPVRVDHHHHDHGQLRRHGPRRQAFKQRQVDHVDQAGQIIRLPSRTRKARFFLYAKVNNFCVTGGDGDCVHGGVHHRDVDQDPGAGLHAAQGELHEKPLELHGLLRCHIWVSAIFC